MSTEIMSTDISPSSWDGEFALEPGLCYLNHAAVAPWPVRTAAAVERFARQNVSRGARDYPAWVAAERELRERLAALIGVQAPDVALQKNTSEALSVIAMGLPWRTGDSVVLAREEFPSNRIAWQALESRGVEVGRHHSSATPSGPSIHLCPSATTKSAWHAAASKVSAPRL